MIPDPQSMISNHSELPEVEQMGIMSLESLNQYDCNNPDRRLLSLNGIVYDVTSSIESYGPDGAYKEFAGHDITLAIGVHRTDIQWLDKFVKMKEKWIETAKGWENFFSSKYQVAGKLENWETDPETWKELSTEELEDLEKGCSIM